MIRESAIEKYLVQQVASFGGRAYKWVSPGNRGVMDRIVMLPGAVICFAEVKSAVGHLRPEQRIQRKTIAGMGFLVTTIRSKADVDLILTELCFGPKDESIR